MRFIYAIIISCLLAPKLAEAITNFVGIQPGIGITNGRLNVDVSAPSDSDDYSADSGEVNAAIGGADNPILLLVNLATNTLNPKI